jgi:hypothetical protein
MAIEGWNTYKILASATDGSRRLLGRLHNLSHLAKMKWGRVARHARSLNTPDTSSSTLLVQLCLDLFNKKTTLQVMFIHVRDQSLRILGAERLVAE